MDSNISLDISKIDPKLPITWLGRAGEETDTNYSSPPSLAKL